MVENLVEIIITEEYHEARADIALSKLSHFSRNHIQQLIKHQCVTINQNPLPQRSYRVQKDDVCKLNITQYQSLFQAVEVSQDYKLDIVYEDESIAVVNKPVGQVVHPAPGYSANTLSQQLFAHYQGKLSTLSNRPGIVHRLDKDTSGLMLIAKTDQAHNHLQAQFENRNITKIYIAGVENCNQLPEHFFLEARIGPHHSKKHLMQAYQQKLLLELPENHTDINYNILDSKHTHSIKEKITIALQGNKEQVYHLGHSPEVKNIQHKDTRYKYAMLECFREQNLLVCYPHTGRQHQIRVQLTQHNHPIIGDKLYSKIPHKRMMLHAFGIQFSHPMTNKLLEIYSALPEDFKSHQTGHSQASSNIL